MRLYELARELGVKSDELVKLSRKLGLKPGNRLSGVSAEEAEALRKAAAVGKKPGPEAEKKARAVPQKKRAPGAKAAQAPAAAKRPAPPAKPAVPAAGQTGPGVAGQAKKPTAVRKRRRPHGGRGQSRDGAVVQAKPLPGRYIPPAAIPRYPRRPMRRGRGRGVRRAVAPPVAATPKSFTFRPPLPIKEFSAAVGIKANRLILKLMQAGSMVSINASLDADQIELLAREFDLDVKVGEALSPESVLAELEKVEDKAEDLAPRAPVVTFLGHVDHGKTSLLDRIRKSNVIAQEHGGITQHIGAYRVTVQGKTVVFLDTPGHEAFTEMRARGANVTDIAVLVVAADDGVMPQTEEAIDHARAANVTVVVAVNKCDKPEANPVRVRQQLANVGLQAEEWGGDTVCVDVSAVTGQGVDELVEMLALVAELQELKANSNKPARGTALEAQVSESLGPVATVLVQEGTLRVGQVVICGAAHGRVKALLDDQNRPMREAGPACPVMVVGLSTPPQAGDRLVVLEDLQKARAIAEDRGREAHEAAMTRRQHVSLENLYASLEEGRVKELLLILKADVRGTLEALSQVVERITSDEVKIRVLRSSVGGITASDVLLADASDAIIVGLHVTADPVTRAMGDEKGVSIRVYNVIYRVKEEIERALVGMLAPEEREVITGHAEIRQVFKISRVGGVAGCYVTDGVVVRNHLARLVRDGTVIHEGRIGSLRRDKDDVREVRDGFECGIHLDSYEDVKVGDVIETFRIEKVARTLDAIGGSAS